MSDVGVWLEVKLPRRVRHYRVLKVLRRWLRRLTRHPRLVTHQDWSQLRRQLPQVMAKLERARHEYNALRARYSLEYCRHRSVIAEREELKRLLGLVASDVLEAWKRSRREGASRAQG